MSVKILSGISGAGKSYYVSKQSPDTRVVSADDYFYDMNHALPGMRKVYKFEPSKLGLAHAECFKHFIDDCQYGARDIIVDNTNTSLIEIAPYVLGARAFGYDIEIITWQFKPGEMREFVKSLEACAKRNAHGVGLRSIQAQHARIHEMRERGYPVHWQDIKYSTEYIEFKSNK